jgi:outer membrane protein OmpA-like peptidoglycan-associated protein
MRTRAQSLNTTADRATQTPVVAGVVTAPVSDSAGKYFGNQATLRRLSRMARPTHSRLEISSTNDPLEAEADRAANHVMRIPNPVLVAAPSTRRISRKCEKCEEEEKTLRPKSIDASAAGEAPPIVHDALRAPGQPLDRSTRAFLEPRFNRDFADVRIHTGADAARSAAAVQAHAYTVGNDIVFGSGRYAPHTESGRSLLAHELAHVIQQERGSGNGSLHRLGDTSQIPQVLSCTVPQGASPPATDYVLFANNSSELDIAAKGKIANFVVNWRAAGTRPRVRLDGFASEPGDQALNWRLSCDRVTAVKAEVMSPTADAGPGIPEGQIDTYMQGETAEFGAEALNRRVSFVLPNAAPPQPTPPPEQQTPSPQQPAPPADMARAAACARNPDCPDDYCRPFATQAEAIADRAANAATVLSRIGSANSRAVPLFNTFIFNPAPAGDISTEFAQDFTASLTTRAMTERIRTMLQEAFRTSPPTFPPGNNFVDVDIFAVLDRNTVNAMLETEMVFSDPFTVPGLIAGGIGKTQESCRVGRNTQGAINDARSVTGTVNVIQNPDGSLLLTPSLTFTVVDTLDFCPGNCGGFPGTLLTIPLSRWEASFISGDVPFRVTFSGPSLVGAYDSED